uniref:Procathepsin L-like isoform X1 n=1 Tax=Pogona vitticeps TaxID=103695 RepID=A0ABM5EM81_9SAUR
MGSCCFLQAKMMPFLGPSMLVALLRVSAALDPARDMAWEDWKSLHGKAYLEGEEASRRVVWEENLRMIEQHNWEASQGKHTYWLGMNHFGDLTNEEFNQMNSFLLDEVELAVGNVSFFHKSATERVPRNVDWREKGYVTRVKNQGRCKSCWAFSATGALENLHFKKTGQRVSLSEQNLVDCSRDQGNHGCCGGKVWKAFEYVRQNGGLSLEQDYPYRGKDGICCRNVKKIGIKISGFRRVPQGNEKALEHAVAKFGPVSVGINFNGKKFQFYKSGIFSADCGHGKLRHAVLVVGYEEKKVRKSYWIVKNSWSEKWGVKGYLYLEKGSNLCGIANEAYYPV